MPEPLGCRRSGGRAERLAAHGALLRVGHDNKTSIIGSTPIAASIHSFAQATLCAERAAAGRRLFRLVSACAPGATRQLTRKAGARRMFARSKSRSTLPVTHLA